MATPGQQRCEIKSAHGKSRHSGVNHLAIEVESLTQKYFVIYCFVFFFYLPPVAGPPGGQSEAAVRPGHARAVLPRDTRHRQQARTGASLLPGEHAIQLYMSSP